MDYECPRCGYLSVKKTNMARHINIKKMCKLSNMDVKPKDYESIILREYNTNELIQEKLNKTNITKIDNSVTNSNNLINITNNITINLNSVNEPNIDYITNKNINECLESLETSMLEMGRKIYFNPKHSENHSVYKTTMKNKIIKYFKDNKWNVGDQDIVINVMTENIMDALGNGSDKYYDLNHKYENDQKFKHKVDRSLIIECYNNKHVKKMID
jgi:acetyltransferase-like isoleucine patch superfamily enzyme